MESKQTITLAPGESKEISFEATPGEARTYSVAIDGLSGSFRATQPSLGPLELSIPGITTQEYMAYWVSRVRCLVKNPNSVPVSRNIYCCFAFGDKNPDDLSQYSPRYWGDAKNTAYPVTLQPGQQVELVSPGTYWGTDSWGTYKEYPNQPM